jgi:hypothetical protein
MAGVLGLQIAGIKEKGLGLHLHLHCIWMAGARC